MILFPSEVPKRSLIETLFGSQVHASPILVEQPHSRDVVAIVYLYGIESIFFADLQIRASIEHLLPIVAQPQSLTTLTPLPITFIYQSEAHPVEQVLCRAYLDLAYAHCRFEFR